MSNNPTTPGEHWSDSPPPAFEPEIISPPEGGPPPPPETLEPVNPEPAAEAPAPAPAPEPTPRRENVRYKFEIGDLVRIPCHGGEFVAEVVKQYPDLQTANDRYEKSYRTILQAPFGKPDPNQPFYYCEVANPTRKPLGVAEGAAKLKWRPPAGGGEKGNG